METSQNRKAQLGSSALTGAEIHNVRLALILWMHDYSDWRVSDDPNQVDTFASVRKAERVLLGITDGEEG
jgi:hypothetical protein